MRPGVRVAGSRLADRPPSAITSAGSRGNLVRSAPYVQLRPRFVAPTGWSMQLQQIKYFLLLCEELSFTRAAQRCNVAQPTLTKSMRSLERELGGPLFRRRPVELSALGK